MTGPRLELTRSQILAFRRRIGSLDRRLPKRDENLRRAAWTGLQDSMPRAAVLSLHARVEATEPTDWDNPGFVQTWGPRFSTYVVPTQDLPIFTLGRLPDDPSGLRRAEETANRLETFLAGRTMTYREAGKGLGVNHNMLRYAAPTGRVLIRWEGAGQPTIRMVPAPTIDPAEARLELARRYLHISGPGTAESFGDWAGIRTRRVIAIFEALGESLTPVRTPIGDAWVLDSDEAGFTAPAGPEAPARLLPSGDTYYLLQGRERQLLVEDPTRRAELWTSRVWPGALLVDGEVAGTWRRDGARLSIRTWRRLSPAAVDAVESEAATLPLPGIEGEISVIWEK